MSVIRVYSILRLTDWVGSYFCVGIDHLPNTGRPGIVNCLLKNVYHSWFDDIMTPQ